MVAADGTYFHKIPDGRVPARRRMPCSMTIDAVRERRKTVTRRHVDTWATLRAGDTLVLIEKGMGLPKGAKQVVITEVVVTDVRVEPLHLMTDTEYGWAEVAREGFGGMEPHEFAEFWLDGNGVRVSDQAEFMAVQVRRIEWRYADDV